MHFEVKLLDNGDVQITSRPTIDEGLTYFRQSMKRNSESVFYGMTANELAGLVGFVTSDGNIVSKTERNHD